MESISEIVRENLIKLRKEKQWTQVEVAKKIGYSDKAISRWETGEGSPDIETLAALADLYEIPVESLFSVYETKSGGERRRHSKDTGRKIAIALLVIVGVWFIGAVVNIYLDVRQDPRAWMAYIWPLPLSFLLAMGFNRLWGNRAVGVILCSGFCWTLITAFYLQLLEYNLYMLFISGVPIQLAIILWACIRTPYTRRNR